MNSMAVRRLAAIVATAIALVAALAGCGKDEFADRSAVISIGGSSQTYAVRSCGLDHQTVFVVARAPDGAVVQGVMDLRKDDKTGIRTSTGMTVDLDPHTDTTRLAAFGAGSWRRRGKTGPAPGTISTAHLHGSRIQFSGRAVPVDAQDQPVSEGKAERFSIDARCDEVDS